MKQALVYIAATTVYVLTPPAFGSSELDRSGQVVVGSGGRATASARSANVTSATHRKPGNPITHIGRDLWRFGTFPFRFRRRHLAPAAIIVGGTGAIMLVDEDIRHAIRKGRRKGEEDDFLFKFRHFGNAYYTMSASGAMYLGGWMFDNRKLRDTGEWSVEAVLGASLISTVIKELTGRWRPEQKRGAFSYEGFHINRAGGRRGDSMAFPSGHSAVAFALATTLTEQYDSWWVKIPAYGLATVTSIQRMDEDAHWASDVFLGAAIGVVVAKTVVRWNRQEHVEIKPVQLRNGETGVAIGLKW